MPAHTLATRLKSAVSLLLVFPLLTFLVASAAMWIPFVGTLTFVILQFSAPFMWLLVAKHGPVLTPLQHGLALWGHYPIAGFIAGYFFPVEIELSRTCAKYVAIRYIAFLAIAVAVGLVLALYAFSHDS